MLEMTTRKLSPKILATDFSLPIKYSEKNLVKSNNESINLGIIGACSKESKLCGEASSQFKLFLTESLNNTLSSNPRVMVELLGSEPTRTYEDLSVFNCFTYFAANLTAESYILNSANNSSNSISNFLIPISNAAPVYEFYSEINVAAFNADQVLLNNFARNLSLVNAQSWCASNSNTLPLFSASNEQYWQGFGDGYQAGNVLGEGPAYSESFVLNVSDSYTLGKSAGLTAGETARADLCTNKPRHLGINNDLASNSIQTTHFTTLAITSVGSFMLGMVLEKSGRWIYKCFFKK